MMMSFPLWNTKRGAWELNSNSYVSTKRNKEEITFQGNLFLTYINTNGILKNFWMALRRWIRRLLKSLISWEWVKLYSILTTKVQEKKICWDRQIDEKNDIPRISQDSSRWKSKGDWRGKTTWHDHAGQISWYLVEMKRKFATVSYTHLTLPTILLV